VTSKTGEGARGERRGRARLGEGEEPSLVAKAVLDGAEPVDEWGPVGFLSVMPLVEELERGREVVGVRRGGAEGETATRGEGGQGFVERAEVDGGESGPHIEQVL
jgi:hypothetical protein